MFGEPIRRREDPRLVSGDGRYLDDLGHDALAAAFVRSPYAHARIVDVDVTAALDVDGLVAIYTYEDLDGRVAHRLPVGSRRGPPRRRAGRHGGRDGPVRGRGRVRADPGHVRPVAAGGRHR